jgi:hypothetical protein
LKHIDHKSFESALTAAVPSPHPDADVLSAFAENALLPRERQDVLAHLASCADCRQVLSLASDAALENPTRSKPLLVSRPVWRILVPSLAAAATIAAVATAVLHHQIQPAPSSSTIAATHTEPPAELPAPLQSPHPSSTKKSPTNITPKSVAPVTPSQPSLPELNATNIAPEAVPSPSASAGTASSSMELRKLQTQAPVSAFANTVAGAAISTARPHWRINEQGQPERALADGLWRPVLPNQAARMHVLSVFNGEVWVGGEKSQVFRSFDNGTSWRLVSLPDKNGIDHSIAHIRFDSAQNIAIDAADGTTWITTDGGETWK